MQTFCRLKRVLHILNSHFHNIPKALKFSENMVIHRLAECIFDTLKMGLELLGVILRESSLVRLKILYLKVI